MLQSIRHRKTFRQRIVATLINETVRITLSPPHRFYILFFQILFLFERAFLGLSAAGIWTTGPRIAACFGGGGGVLRGRGVTHCLFRVSMSADIQPTTNTEMSCIL